MTLVQKIKAIDAVIDENVRQFLIMDGGNMEVIDVKVSDEYIDVRAAFQEEKRGLIAFAFLSVAVVLNLYAFYASFWVSLERFLIGSSLYGEWGFSFMVGAIIKIAIWCAMNYFLWRYTWRWIRVELFLPNAISLPVSTVKRAKSTLIARIMPAVLSHCPGKP